MTSPTWTQLRLTTVAEQAEVCAQLLLDCGCGGAQIDDTALVLDESEDATLEMKTSAVVTGYLPPEQSPHETRVCLQEALRRGSIAAQLEAVPLAAQNWSEAWRDNFPPLRIGPFLIVPPWTQAPSGEVTKTNAAEDAAGHADGHADGHSDAVLIRIDPGLAFGTGQHPTTRLCLELIGEHLGASSHHDALHRATPSNRTAASSSATSSVPPRAAAPKMLDVGCGSGVLSIAAAKLGARVWASDLDRFCTEATRDNARANGVAPHIVQARGVGWTAARFDVVVANLMSVLLIALAPELARATRSGGTLIVSGISAPRADEVEAALCQAGFTTQEKREADGEQRGDFVERWTAFVMKKETEYRKQQTGA